MDLVFNMMVDGDEYWFKLIMMFDGGEYVGIGKIIKIDELRVFIFLNGVVIRFEEIIVMVGDYYGLLY